MKVSPLGVFLLRPLYFRVSRVDEPNVIHLSDRDLCQSPLLLLCTSVSWKDITMIHVSCFLFVYFIVGAPFSAGWSELRDQPLDAWTSLLTYHSVYQTLSGCCFLHMENWEHLLKGLGDKETYPCDMKSKGLWESQCDILQCSSRDQSIPMVTALPHCLLRAWLCSQKCTFPTQVSFAPLLVCFQCLKICVGSFTSSILMSSVLLAHMATLAAWAINSSWVHPEDFQPESFLCWAGQPSHPMEMVLSSI